LITGQAPMPLIHDDDDDEHDKEEVHDADDDGHVDWLDNEGVEVEGDEVGGTVTSEVTIWTD